MSHFVAVHLLQLLPEAIKSLVSERGHAFEVRVGVVACLGLAWTSARCPEPYSIVTYWCIYDTYSNF